MIHGSVTGRKSSGRPELRGRENMMFPWLICVCFVHSFGLLSHVQHYEVVRPQRRQERRTRSLRDSQFYPDRVQYDLTIEGRNHTVYLEKNRKLFGESYSETHYLEDGKQVTTSPNQEHCFYHGHVGDEVDSSVSVGICSGISGFLRVRQQVYLIEPLGQTDDEDHAVYRQEHQKISGRSSCGPSSSATPLSDQIQDQAPPPAGLRRPRSLKTKRVPGLEMFVELFVVVDNIEYKRYGKETRSRILGAVNHIDKLYRPLNIRIMLVGLEIWSYRDYIHVDVEPGTTLDNFLVWRKSDLLPRVKHDNAQFVTGRDFVNDTVGLANKFAMCTENSAGVNQDHQNNPLGLASTIAHEMGHNFGLSHDATGCVCGSSYSSQKCVMTETLGVTRQVYPEFFSSCSLQELSEFLERAQPSCLHRPTSVRTIAVGPLCGNAMLDPGEECDCGTVEECNNPCCDASSCRLTDGSQCAHGQCCESCQFKASGSMCRTSAGVCDLPEYCTGESPDCPENSFQMNGKPCYNQAPGFCHDGQCPTREHHCWRLFGEGAKVGPDVCYNRNRLGDESNNCGRNKSSFTPCSDRNLKCGSTVCVGGGDSITGKQPGVYFVFGIECKVAMEDDKTRNINMVPTGSVCGPNKVCLNNRCVDVSVYGNKDECAKKCNNHGVCNHRNQCHCDPSWAPPHCDVKYADLPKAQTVMVAGVCAALSTLLVITVVITGLVCCRRNNMKNNYTDRRKVKSAAGEMNPMFQEAAVKNRPEISQPTLLESTVTQSCSPLVVTVTPSTPAPQIEPLPPLNKQQNKEAKPSPQLVPPVKPSPPLVPPVKPSPPLVPPVKPSPPLVPPVKPSPPPAPRTKPSPPPRPLAKPRLHRLT